MLGERGEEGERERKRKGGGERKREREKNSPEETEQFSAMTRGKGNYLPNRTFRIFN